MVTYHTLQNGQVAGTLGLNGYTGDVWYRAWHGDFIAMQAFDHETPDRRLEKLPWPIS